MFLSILLGAAFVVTATPALADPIPDGTDEGDDTAVLAQLDQASAAYTEAQDKLDSSKERQRRLDTEVKSAEQAVALERAKIADVAAESYRTSGVFSKIEAVLSSRSTQGLMDKMAYLDQLRYKEQQKIGAFTRAREALSAKLRAVDAEITEQTKQRDEMAKRKKQTERILADANKAAEQKAAKSSPSVKPSAKASGKPTPSTPAPAKTTPAPAKPPSSHVVVGVKRNKDGSLPKESCTANDPTTKKCITPRMLHVYKQTRAAGYDFHATCWQYRDPSAGSQHPVGRACDWSSSKKGFRGTAKGAEKAYGDRLAKFYTANARKLAVRFVIWYKRIWFPSSGWKRYFNAGSSSPNENHTNHVHLSIN